VENRQFACLVARQPSGRRRWTVVETYRYAGISGARLASRPGLDTKAEGRQPAQVDQADASACASHTRPCHEDGGSPHWWLIVIF
jgi:hypothetical protein